MTQGDLRTTQTDSPQGATLRVQAEALAQSLPGFLAGAERLANAVQPGLHGRRRAGPGENFWQYRAAMPQDGMRGIDWRRSARGDDLFARQHEWQVAQSVQVWVDPGAGMDFGDPAKSLCAAQLALAIAILSERGGERIGIAGRGAAGTGQVQLGRIARGLIRGCGPLPDGTGWHPHGRAVLIGDFLDDIAPLERAVAAAADRGLRGALCQVLTPEETDFPYRGRTLFEAPSDARTHETMAAHALRSRYLERLAERRAALASLAARTGWQFLSYRTDRPAADALLWLMRAIEAPR